MREPPPLILHLTTVGETLRFLAGQPAFMAERGWRTEVLSSPGTELEGFGRRENVPAHGVRMFRRISPFADLRAVWEIRRVVRRRRPTIVHAHTPKAGFLGMIAARWAGAPYLVYHVHGLRFATAAGWRRVLLRATEWGACHLATRVLAVSASVADALVSEGLCPADRVKVLAKGSVNGVDAAGRFAPALLSREARRETRARHRIPDDACVLGYIGRIARDKGMAELASAWDCLADRFPSLHLLLVGPIDQWDPPAREVLARLEAHPRVHFAGLQWDTPVYYAAMDVVTLPSYREGIAVQLLEAGAMGIPVVASRVVGCVDVVEDGRNGILVEPHDASALAAAIATLIDDPARRRAVGTVARTRVLRDFSPGRVRSALHHEYTRLVGSQHAGHTGGPVRGAGPG